MRELDTIMVLIIATLMITGLLLAYSDEEVPLKKNEVLICKTDSLKGYKIIDRSKIVRYEYSTGYWIFNNGYAKNCYKEKVNTVD